MWPFKDKKQKCRTSPDCGWNMKPNHCDIFYNCKFNQKIAMKHQGNKGYQTELHELKQKRLQIDHKIIDLQNRIRVEKEHSPAEKWGESQSEELKLKQYFNDVWEPKLHLGFTQAHEAGQKHGAEVERGRYTELIETCKYMSLNHSVIFAIGKNSVALELLERALKNLEENEPASDEPEIKGVFIGISTMNNIIIQPFENSGTCRAGTKYKLTPIKD